MKGISCNSNLLSDLPVEQAMDVLGEHGYAAIDICLEIAPPFVPVPTPHLSPEDGAAKRDRVRKRAEEAGIAIAALNAHTNLCARDPAERAANARFLEGIHPNGGRPGGSHRGHRRGREERLRI